MTVLGAWLPDGCPIDLSVQGDRLVGFNPACIGGALFFDTALIGAELGLSVNGDVYYLRVASAGVVESYVGGDPLRTYRLRVRPAGYDLAAEAALCSRYDSENDAVVFGGERYTNRLTVEVDAKTTWFNIGCPHTPAYHMQLWRHTSAATDAAHQTTWQQRQAMYKMLNGDFCGIGVAEGEGWQPTLATDSHGWFPSTPLDLSYIPNPLIASAEAVWTENGAICLDQLRYRGGASGISCKLPSCDDALGRTTWPPIVWQSLGHFLSANAP